MNLNISRTTYWQQILRWRQKASKSLSGPYFWRHKQVKPRWTQIHRTIPSRISAPYFHSSLDRKNRESWITAHFIHTLDMELEFRVYPLTNPIVSMTRIDSSLILPYFLQLKQFLILKWVEVNPVGTCLSDGQSECWWKEKRRAPERTLLITTFTDQSLPCDDRFRLSCSFAFDLNIFPFGRINIRWLDYKSWGS